MAKKQSFAEWSNQRQKKENATVSGRTFAEFAAQKRQAQAAEEYAATVVPQSSDYLNATNDISRMAREAQAKASANPLMDLARETVFARTDSADYLSAIDAAAKNAQRDAQSRDAFRTTPYHMPENPTGWDYVVKTQKEATDAFGKTRVGLTIGGGIQSAGAGYANAPATINDYFNQNYAAPTVFNPDGTVNWEASVAAHKPSETVQAAVDRAQKRADDLQTGAAEKIAAAKDGLGWFGRTLVDAGVSGTQMAGDALLNFIVPGAGLTAMGVRSFGSAAGDARREGADVNQQMLYGLANAAVEVLSEKIGDIPGIYGGGWLDDAVKKVTQRWASNPLLYRAAMAAASGLGESIEEFAAGLIEPGLKSIYNGEGYFQNYTPEDWADMGNAMASAFLLGSVSGGLSPNTGNTQDIVDYQTPTLQNTQPAVQQEAEQAQPVEQAEPAQQPITQKLLRSIAEDPEQLAALGIDTKGKSNSQIREEIRAALENQNAQQRQAKTNMVRSFAETERAAERMTDIGAQTFVDFYDDAQDPEAYIREMSAVYNAGKNGKDAGSVSTPTLSSIQRDAAYLSGQAAQRKADAAKPGIDAVRQYSESEQTAGRMSENGAQIMRSYYDGTQNADDYIRAMTDAYNAGIEGKDVRSLASPVLTRTQRDAAYMAGRAAARQGQTVLAQANIPAAQQTATQPTAPVQPTTAQPAPQRSPQSAPMQRTVQQPSAQGTPAQTQKKPAVRAAKPGLDMEDANTTKAKLTRRESRALDALGKVIGRKIQFVDTITAAFTDQDGNVRHSGANAEIDGDTIRIALDSDDPFLVAAVHEVVHGIRDLDEASYQTLAKFVANNMTDDYRKVAEWEEARKGYNPEQIPEEIVCDAFGRMLGDEAKLQQFVQDDRNAAQKLFDALHDLLVKVQRALSGGGQKLTDNQRAVYSDLEGRIETMLSLFEEALNNVSGAENIVQNAEDAIGVHVDEKTESANPQSYSLKSFRESDYVTDRDNAAKDLSSRLGISVQKAKRYIDSVNSVAKMIADDRARLDYESSPGRSSFVGNSEYGGSIDFSTVCKKRRLYTGTIDAIQNAMPDRALTADEMLKIRAEMKKRGYEVSCGLCYVEGSRVNIGKYTQEFLDELKQGEGYVPTMAEMNTSEGQEKLRAEHPEVYDQYVEFMNKLAQRKPKLFQMATEYQGEILKKFKNDSTVEQKNRNGGLRLQSFSDFEIIHLIDCMQVVMDMSRVGLAGQAYTKVPDFAWALGDTGMKINLSMIAKGVDPHGHIIYDEVEGMKHADAKALRDRYSKNVGTILVVFNDAQLKAALNDSFVDFIIPFHRSQWNKGQYEMLGLPDGAKDYTDQQNEAYIERRLNKNGKPIRPSNYMPSEYWDFSKSGKENAEEYLRMCAEDGRRPKFYKLLVDNGDGSFSLQPDGSTDGYWKLLTDFKMYDNKGKGSPQMPVRPDFNMDEAERMLNSYQGGHQKFPVAQDVVDDFVNKKFSRSGRDVLDEYVEQYGEIKRGEKPARDFSMPKRTTDKTKVSMTARTVAEAGATPESFVPTIENLAANHVFDYTPYSDEAAISNAAQIAARKGWSRTLTDWSKEVSNGGVSKTNTAVGWALYNNAVNSGDTETALNVLNLIVKHQRNAAQAVQATRILKQLNPETQLYNAENVVADINEDLKKRLGKDAPEVEIDPDLAEQFLRAKNQEDRDKVMTRIFQDIGRKMPTTFLDRWTAWRYTAMLGNVRTIGRNIAGNAGFAPVVLAKDLTATALEGIVSKATGGKIERTKGNVIGRSDLLSAAWDDYANMQEAAMGQSKYSDRQAANKEIEDARRIFGNTKSKVWNKTGGAALEGWRKGTNFLMDVTDVIFNKPQYVLAMAQYCAANGISAEQIRSGKGLEKARAYAAKEAQKATYRDTNDFSQMVSSLGKSWLHSENAWKRGIATLGEGVLPFRKTPANILARGVEYSPIGLIKSLTYDAVQVKKGNMSAADMIDDISAGLTGTGLLALGVYLAAQGLLRGRGRGDDKKKEFADLEGHQDYALEIGGKSYTLDWLAPEALPLFIGANLWEAAADRKDGMQMKDILTAISNVSEPMLQMSMLQSLNDLLDGNTYGNEETSALMRKLSSAATSYLTQAFPTLLGQVERTGEGKRMTTYTDKNGFLTGDMQYILGKISAKIPGWDFQQIPYIDAWGREELTGKFLERAGQNFVNPSYVSKVNESDMEKEIERLYDSTGESVFPQRAAKYINVDGERKDLSAKEYVTYATEKGRTSYTVVGGMVESDLYKGLNDDEKATCVKEAYTYANQTARTAAGGKITESWVEKAQNGVTRGIKPETYILVKNAVSDVEALKDKNGNSISNSKGLQIMQAIYAMPGLTYDQRKYLFECFGVGKTVIDYNKALVDQKLKEMKQK